MLILLCRKCGSTDLDFNDEGKIVCQQCGEIMTRSECAIADVESHRNEKHKS
ncbi:MAG: hypothetical protein KAX39_06160 [candidate division Zixibacteria bacterium]|nr:hypothetical protein [candidate division Zixibacteria bacterium]